MTKTEYPWEKDSKNTVTTCSTKSPTNTHPEGWKEYLEDTKIKYDINENTDEDEANNTSPKEKILKAFKSRIEKEGENKSKIKSPRGPPRMDPGTAETLHAPTRKNAVKYHIWATHQH